MTIFTGFAIFALGMLIGHSIAEKANNNNATIAVEEFCDNVAKKIIQRLTKKGM